MPFHHRAVLSIVVIYWVSEAYESWRGIPGAVVSVEDRSPSTAS
jgi:hypothetical protein